MSPILLPLAKLIVVGVMEPAPSKLAIVILFKNVFFPSIAWSVIKSTAPPLVRSPSYFEFVASSPVLFPWSVVVPVIVIDGTSLLKLNPLIITSLILEAVAAPILGVIKVGEVMVGLVDNTTLSEPVVAIAWTLVVEELVLPRIEFVGIVWNLA